MSTRTPVISLGAGVQSSTLLLMSARGELDDLAERPRLAVFADTKGEGVGTYEWLPALRMEALRGGIELIVASSGDLRADVLTAIEQGSSRASQPPFFSRGKNGKPQITPRGCTRDYKIRVVRRALRERGFGPSHPVEMWMGISHEESLRMKDSEVAWVRNRWPLIEREMSRHDCELWMVRHGYPVPPKSSCVFCPLHSNSYWRTMQRERQAEFATAVDFDLRIRQIPGMEGETFLHRSLVPLGDVDLRNAEDRGQETFAFPEDECEGMCGV